MKASQVAPLRTLYALAYGWASQESLKTYGNPWEGNIFEQNVNLYWGSYHKHYRYGTAFGLYC